MLHIRWAVARDLPRILEIECAAHSYAWTEDDFRARLRQRNCISMVAEDRGTDILGFAIYELHRHKLDVLNLAVPPKCQRRGVGTALINKLKYKVCSHRREALVLFAPEAYTSAHLFLRKMGFMGVGVVRSPCCSDTIHGPPESGELHYVFRWNVTQEYRTEHGFYPLALEADAEGG